MLITLGFNFVMKKDIWHSYLFCSVSSYFIAFYVRRVLKNPVIVSGKKAQSGEESETYDEFAEAGDDISRLAAGKSVRRRKKKKRKEEEEEGPPPINEEPIVAEELIPLMDQSIARTDGKALLNARVIFVIGECAEVLFSFDRGLHTVRTSDRAVYWGVALFYFTLCLLLFRQPNKAEVEHLFDHRRFPTKLINF